MSDPIPYAPWWKLNLNGHAIHVNADGSYWWWDRTRMFINRNRPVVRWPRGTIMLDVKRGWRGHVSMAWMGKCTPFEEPVVTRAWTARGLNEKAERKRHLHFLQCEHPENHQSFVYAQGEAMKWAARHVGRRHA